MSLLFTFPNDVTFANYWCIQAGLLTAVADWLPQVEHRKCTRHLYANFKKRFSGVQFKRLFWGATTSTLVQQFEQRMAQLRLLDESAYDYLIERNPNSLSRALFEMDISFNNASLLKFFNFNTSSLQEGCASAGIRSSRAEVEHPEPGALLLRPSLMILGSYGRKGFLSYGFERGDGWCEF
ncbi:hypothetical protein Tco_1499586 [Tanacetum coccineum]